MKKSKNLRLVLSIAVLTISLAGLIGYCMRLPSNEITRVELTSLIESQSIVEATIVPSAYTGIYAVEGKYKSGEALKPFAITTHLDEAQAKALFAQKTTEVEIP